TASTPPGKNRKVLPMCPVQIVTYVSGRSHLLPLPASAHESSAASSGSNGNSTTTGWLRTLLLSVLHGLIRIHFSTGRTAQCGKRAAAA
ncbi:hypothetical protein, partial [Mesorhizobium sp. M0195]|uniref:hypothetical protein n=1 Tax=Mesorhizobium sp. M0195 TaxID=2956910 RepID=UPI00333D1325